ncbi:patatin-17-like [Vigna radiata var. radiata]|uniref:Patatin n=1 Tax=Vigna radiata var. radiata TaxID=3916 RepID=A0A1S3VCR5_VIGRR|nr:patatin-17-like [Vigna radiata var. radiata]
MAHLVFFVLLFVGQLIGGFSIQKLTPSDSGNVLTVLSIDGGGIRGIIPAKVLDYLDKALKAKDPNADLANYFDVIGGTGTGGLITALLATPSLHDPTRPAFTPAQIVDFYKENGPHVFNLSRLHGPAFDGEFLHNITRELFKDTRLSQTLTNVVIPTFDIKTQKPVIFSNYKLGRYPYFNALMSDISISASAAPTLLPPYYFENDGVEFNLISGADLSMFSILDDSLVNGNPTRATVSEALRHNKYSRILILSLGTGTKETQQDLDVEMAATWTNWEWLIHGITFIDRATTSMAEYYHGSLFQQPRITYLRIQEYELDPAYSSLVEVAKGNMDGLEETGKELLEEKVKKINLNTFSVEEGVGTNAEALDRLADILYGERQHRLKQKSIENGGRPFLQTLRVPSDKIQANWAFQKNKVL